jgi:hypothetical protein
MTEGGARGDLWSDLVNGLLDARTDPATTRFDAELATAVAAGELSPRTAQRLRFWQRAAVNAADDHARTVVPAVISVLETARSQAQAYVEESCTTLDEADGAAGADGETVGGATVPAAVPPAAPSPWSAATTPSPFTRLEEPRRASTAGASGPSTLEEPAARLFVADLRDVPASTDRP